MTTDTTETPTTPKPGSRTTEFYLTLLANAIGALLAFDVIIENSLAGRISGAALMVLATLGYQVTRAKVKIATAIAKSSVLLLVLLSACGSSAGILTRNAAGNFYDCVRPEVKQAGLELGDVFDRAVRSTLQNDGTLDRQALKSTARGLKDPALRCLFAAAVTTLGTAIASSAGAPQSEPLQVDRADVNASFDEIRAEVFDGARFNLEDGVH